MSDQFTAGGGHPNSETEPRVWVGCLACYDAGRLVGKWADAIDADCITSNELHGGKTNHEELWCFDAEGLPFNREMSPHAASRWGAVMQEVDPMRRDALIAWVRSGDYMSEGSGDLPSLSEFEERYAGEWESFDAYALELFEDYGFGLEIPEHLTRYFDFEAWTRDIAYDYVTEPALAGGVHIFRCL